MKSQGFPQHQTVCGVCPWSCALHLSVYDVCRPTLKRVLQKRLSAASQNGCFSLHHHLQKPDFSDPADCETCQELHIRLWPNCPNHAFDNARCKKAERYCLPKAPLFDREDISPALAFIYPWMFFAQKVQVGCLSWHCALHRPKLK